MASKETTDSQSQSQDTNNNVHHLTLLLLCARLEEVRKLWLSQIKLLVTRLVTQLQSMICISKILHCLLVDSVLSCNLIEKFSSIFLIFVRGPLVLFLSEIMSLPLPFNAILVFTHTLCGIASTNKSSCVAERSINHYCYACHYTYFQHYFQESPTRIHQKAFDDAYQ